MRTLVFNGWAAGPETWALCTFPRDWVFDYIEQLDGLPERVLSDMDDVLLVGFSMGGSTALRMFLKYPEKVRGMVLVSATPCMMEQRAKRVGDDGRETEEVVWKGMSLRRRAALKFGTQMVFRNDPSPLYAEMNLDRGLDYLQKTDLRPALLSFAAHPVKRIPVAVIQSDRDGIVRPQNAAFLKEVFPQATVTMVSGNEHVLPIAEPKLIDDVVQTMVADVG